MANYKLRSHLKACVLFPCPSYVSKKEIEICRENLGNSRLLVEEDGVEWKRHWRPFFPIKNFVGPTTIQPVNQGAAAAVAVADRLVGWFGLLVWMVLAYYNQQQMCPS